MSDTLVYMGSCLLGPVLSQIMSAELIFPVLGNVSLMIPMFTLNAEVTTRTTKLSQIVY